MQVEELYDLTTWVIAEIAGKQIIQKYQQLHQVLQQNSQPNQQKQPFAGQQAALISAISDVPLFQLSVGQLDVLDRIGISQNVGVKAVELVEDVLFKNALDVATAAQRINQCVSELNTGVQWAQQEKGLLDKIIVSESVSDIGNNVMLRVHFAGEASVENLTDFKDWSKTWWDIGRGIAMAHNQSPESIAVVGASKGSIIVSLVATYGVAKTVSGIILEALKVVEKYYDIMKKAQEVRALKLANDKAEKALEQEAQNEKALGGDRIVETIIQELGLNPESEGDKITALTSATKKLLDFIVKGGEVDFVAPDDEGDGAEEADDESGITKGELRDRFHEVRRLEREVKRLEHDRD